MFYINKGDRKTYKLVKNFVTDENKKYLILKICKKDDRKNEHNFIRHDSKNISFDNVDDDETNRVEYELASRNKDSHAIAMQKILYEELDKSICQLTEAEELIIRLFFFKQLNTVEISKKLGIAQQNVSKTKLRALKKLKKDENLKKLLF